MIEGNECIKIVESYFKFLVAEFDFKVSDEKVRGNAFYDVQYRDQTRIVSISYENIEGYFLVTIFMLQNGELPDYDDKSKTLHLNKINGIILSKVAAGEIDLNNGFFLNFVAKSELERKLLKSAKELRLCLKHFDKLK
jgi:sensor histidine kinase YesM